MTALLSVTRLDAFYGAFQALFGIDFELRAGESVAVIGANGAGKSTFLKALAGLVRSRPDAIRFEGEDVGDRSAPQMLRLGVALVPEGRRLFPSLTVEENLLVGAYSGLRPQPWTLPRIYELFPVLRERRNSPSTILSGGQQQMVAIGRALMSNPRLLLCDELSLGLAPIIVEDIYRVLPQIKAGGTSLIIVEQNIARAMRHVDRFYCLQEGRVTLTGEPGSVGQNEIHRAYFGA